MSANAHPAIYHCPFCADEDLRPQEEPAGAWACGACVRVFTVALVRVDTSRVPGHVDPESVAPTPAVTTPAVTTPTVTTPTVTTGGLR